jgi:hypothetical protein
VANLGAFGMLMVFEGRSMRVDRRVKVIDIAARCS